MVSLSHNNRERFKHTVNTAMEINRHSVSHCYVIVTPIRNESAHLDRVIAAVSSQTLTPTEWVLVDDGSTDGTTAIAQRAAEEYPWIRVIIRPDRGARAPGSGVVAAFYDGFLSQNIDGWQFLVKLDGDIIVPPDYFARCLSEFDKDPRLGIGGGAVYHFERSSRRSEPHPDFHVRGATKIYRRACWEDIGGLVRSTGWDTVDELTAQHLGWVTRTFRHIGVLHLRTTGSADGKWRNAVKNGLANYVAAYHPLFMLAKCVRRFVTHPWRTEAFGLAFGFLTGHLRKVGRIDDPELVSFIQRQQLRRLMFMESMWR